MANYFVDNGVLYINWVFSETPHQCILVLMTNLCPMAQEKPQNHRVSEIGLLAVWFLPQNCKTDCIQCDTCKRWNHADCGLRRLVCRGYEFLH